MLASATQQQHKSSWFWSLQYFLNLFPSLHPWGHLPLQTLVDCHLSLHGPTLWHQMKFLKLSRWFLTPCLCSCCSPTWNAPLPHLVTSSLRLRLGIISFTVYPTKNELNTCLETLCQVLGNHRCSGFSWAGVFMFHVSRQQEGALEERGCPPPSGSFPRLLVLGWSKHFAVMLPSCSVLCHHGSKPMDWSFLLPVWLH